MPNDGITIAAGRAAWARLKKSRTLEDYLAVGRALLVGRRLAMDKVRATEPKGGKYAKVFARWLRENGFSEIPHSARNCSMAIAQNENGALAWIKTLPPVRRPRIYPLNIWSAYRVTVLRKSRRDWRDRLGIDEATALRAHEDVKMALRDVARRQLYNISEGVLDEFVYAAFVATLNALDIAVPQGLIRKVAYVNGNGNRVTVPRAEATSR